MHADHPRNPDPLALIGDPVAQSLSPLIHNSALKAIGLPPVYVACRVLPENLERAVVGLAALGFRGANVTIPHKESVMALVDHLTDSATAVGAVNTLHFDRASGTVLGDNTDVVGFCAPLERFSDRIRGADVVVLGSGGAARAAAYGLTRRFEPGTVRVASRRAERSRALSDSLGLSGTMPWPVEGDDLSNVDVLVNATPLGAAAAPDRSPISDPRSFRRGQLMYDLVYTPSQTRFMTDATAAGAQCIGGLPMLIGQAAAAFRRWMGVEMPVGAVVKALSDALGLRSDEIIGL